MINGERHILGTLPVTVLALVLLSGALTGCQKDFTYKRPTLETSQSASALQTIGQFESSPETAALTDYT